MPLLLDPMDSELPLEVEVSQQLVGLVVRRVGGVGVDLGKVFRVITVKQKWHGSEVVVVFISVLNSDRLSGLTGKKPAQFVLTEISFLASHSTISSKNHQNKHCVGRGYF